MLKTVERQQQRPCLIKFQTGKSRAVFRQATNLFLAWKASQMATYVQGSGDEIGCGMSKGGSNDSQVADHCCHCSYRIRLLDRHWYCTAPGFGGGFGGFHGGGFGGGFHGGGFRGRGFDGGYGRGLYGGYGGFYPGYMVTAIPRTATTATDQV
jgi:hypothetical protein